MTGNKLIPEFDGAARRVHQILETMKPVIVNIKIRSVKRVRQEYAQVQLKLTDMVSTNKVVMNGKVAVAKMSFPGIAPRDHAQTIPTATRVRVGRRKDVVGLTKGCKYSDHPRYQYIKLLAANDVTPPHLNNIEYYPRFTNHSLTHKYRITQNRL